MVSKVQEKYPAYMTTVDAKVRPRPSAASERTTWRFFTAPRVSTGGIFLDFFVPTATEGSFFLSSLSRFSSTTSSRFAPPTLHSSFVALPSQVDTAVTLLQSIWADKIAPSAPVAYAKSALALTPEKLEELKATREAYFAKIENTLALLRAKAVALPEKVTAAVTAAIAEARAQVDNAQLFEKVKAAYETVLKYPAVVAVLERAAPAAAKAADAAAPYVAKAAAFAEPYVAAVKTKVMPSKPVEQLD